MGVSVYEAMKEADVFPPYMLKMILMGGETGYLEAVFRGLSVYYEERHQMERMLKETIAFPLVLLIMMIAVVMILTVEVLPVFQNVFSQLGGTLSPGALFFMNAGFSLLEGKVFFFVMIILVVFAVSAVVFHENTREKWNRFWKKIFVRTAAGRLKQKVASIIEGFKFFLSFFFFLVLGRTANPTSSLESAFSLPN